MTETFEPPLSARVIAAWEVNYPDPLDGRTGETLTLGEEDLEWPGWLWCVDPRGKSGWTPVLYIDRNDDGVTGTLLCDYTARELGIEAGDEVRLHKLESRWYWAINDAGRSGWIPASHVEIVGSAQ